MVVRFFVSRWDEVARLRPLEDIYVQKGQEGEGARRALYFLQIPCFAGVFLLPGLGWVWVWDGMGQGRAQQDRRIDGWMDGWIGDQSLSESLNCSLPRSV